MDSVSANSVAETPLLFLSFLATSLTVLVLAVGAVMATRRRKRQARAYTDTLQQGLNKKSPDVIREAKGQFKF